LGGWETGGMNVYVRELSRHLGQQGIAVDVYTRRQDPGLPTIVEFAPRLMAVQVDEGGGAILRRKIEALGVKVHTAKSTTLIAALHQVIDPTVNVLTIEDPVEYIIRGARQLKIGHKMSFDQAIRGILRHDPDIVLVGEMRDKETAEIGMKAAMTGHLLFTTLHANTSSAAIPRLIDMGIEPFVVASSVLAIIGQRLVRRICTHCKLEYRPDDAEFPSWYGDAQRNVPFFKGSGCEVCRDTGFKGRTAVYELLEVTAEVSAAVARRITPAELERVANIRDMRADALDKVRAGVTTLAEAQRVLG
jgi:type IV pilus assembly protein PilB